MTGVGKAIRKYLERYAEPEAQEVPDFALGPASGARWGHVLCIPAYGEGRELLAGLDAVPPGPRGPVLILVVLNEPENAPAHLRAANRALPGHLLRRYGAPLAKAERLSRFDHPRGALLLIDRAGPGCALPTTQGVGLARKIASDVALRIWARDGLIAPWLHCSDADALLPEDYFERPEGASGSAAGPRPSALLYDFVHVPEGDSERQRAVLRYEIFLRYYVLGLRHAGSPYAHHSLGSTLAIAPEAYAAVRGFPRRAAGEDFHLLAKLAKVGRMRALRGAPIRLSGRVSERVPFGTGAGVARELGRIRRGRRYPAYDPESFNWLRVWLQTLVELEETDRSGEGSTRPIERILARQCDVAPGVDRAALWGVLDKLGAVAAATARGTPRGRWLHERFDALQTLRFLHAVRDAYLPEIPLEDAVARAAFCAVNPSADLAVLRNELARAEARDSSSSPP